MSNENYTIAESFVLPSKGLIYSTPINPNVKLRSMTTAEEMRRLAPTDTSYKVMSDIIEACMVEGPKDKLSVYDMCIGDYQYLLHKIRVVTYGNDYKLAVRCPHCGSIHQTTINLDDLEVSEYDESMDSLKTITLPRTKREVGLRIQTPRILDNIAKRKKELQKKSGDLDYDPTLSLTLMSMIDTIDGEKLDPGKLEKFVKTLPMMDANYLIQSSNKLNGKVGISTDLSVECKHCGKDIDTTFRYTSEFFGPEID